jgi:hypothetical protein
MRYTYTIYDGHPGSAADRWLGQTDIPVEANNDDEVIDALSDTLIQLVSGLRAADGYAPGQKIYMSVRNASTGRQVALLCEALPA